MIQFKSKDLILFTGAGFTKNFGGYLAEEMWSKIFNNREIQNSPKLREALIGHYDFESVYSKVLSDEGYSEAEKETLKRAVERVYESLDAIVKEWTFNNDSPYPVNRYGLGDLLTRFAGEADTKGFFFTLNQDLFFERQFHYKPLGAPSFNQEIYMNRATVLEKAGFVTLPREGIVERAEAELLNNAGLLYIKLHGSYGWLSSNGLQQMVIGKNKTQLIQDEPLLVWYFDLLKKLIKEGYGFGDQHINELLLEGVEKHGLSIFIVSTRSFQDLEARLQNGHFYAMGILKGIKGYYPYSLKEIFPGDQSRTTHAIEILEGLLGN